MCVYVCTCVRRRASFRTVMNYDTSARKSQMSNDLLAVIDRLRDSLITPPRELRPQTEVNTLSLTPRSLFTRSQGDNYDGAR